MEEILKQFDLSLTDSWMILVGAVFFVVLWRFLAKALFEPFLRLTEAREAATTGAADLVRENHTQAQKLTEEYESKLQEARISIQKDRLALLAIGRKDAAKIHQGAQEASERHLAEGRERLEKELESIRAQGVTQVGLLANLVVEKLKPTQIQ